MGALNACRYVSKNSRHVKLKMWNFENFRRALESYNREESWASATGPLVEGTGHVTELSVLREALLFKFWKRTQDGLERFETEYKGKKYHGATAMAACIRRALDKGIPINEPDYLKNMNYEEAEKVFEGNMTIPLIDDRVAIMRELGNKGERLDAFLEGEPNDLWSLVETLSEKYPSYRDVSIYNGMTVPFFKRAQLLFSTLHEQGYLEVKGLRSGTIMADYRVPQALRELGMIEYSQGLASKVDSHELIPAGSEEEIEMRALSIVAADSLAKIYKLSIMRVDEVLWQYGRRNCTKPHHLTITTFY